MCVTILKTALSVESIPSIQGRTTANVSPVDTGRATVTAWSSRATGKRESDTCSVIQSKRCLLRWSALRKHITWMNSEKAHAAHSTREQRGVRRRKMQTGTSRIVILPENIPLYLFLVLLLLLLAYTYWIEWRKK